MSTRLSALGAMAIYNRPERTQDLVFNGAAKATASSVRELTCLHH